jgi:hypothetical protein
VAKKNEKERAVWRDRWEHFVKSLLAATAATLVGAIAAFIE